MQGSDALSVSIQPGILVALRQRNRFSNVTSAGVAEYKLQPGKGSQRRFIVAGQGVAMGRLWLYASAATVEEYNQPQPSHSAYNSIITSESG